MSVEATTPLKLFYCYAREDKNFRDGLDRSLANLKRKYNITSWSDREISAGTEWEKEIDTQLKSAHLILLLISSDFMASEYCYGIEMEQALEQHTAGKARVIPIILRPVDWKEAPFHRLQILPSDAKPITQWQDRDEALLDVAQGIRIAIEELLDLPKRGSPEAKQQREQQWVEEGNTCYHQNRYEEAIAAYDEAIRLNPMEATAYNNKGATLQALNRYEEAIAAYDEAIRLNPKIVAVYINKGTALQALKRHGEAIAAYDEAIRSNPMEATAYRYKFMALESQNHAKALAVFDDLERANPRFRSTPTNNMRLLMILTARKESLERKPKLI